jgi:hypothetical protein
MIEHANDNYTPPTELKVLTCLANTTLKGLRDLLEDIAEANANLERDMKG